MDGTESYLNSGWIWPEGQNPPEALSITDITVTFGNPGTYNYVFTVHPWMIRLQTDGSSSTHFIKIQQKSIENIYQF
jgi:hypothetical protein